MKRCLFLLLFLAVAISSCEPRDDITDPPEEKTFDFELSAPDAIDIDQAYMVSIDANERVRNVEISEDGFATTFASFGVSQLGDNFSFNLSFDRPALRNLEIKLTSISGQEVIKSTSVDVQRGNAVKINRFVVSSFFRINETWDDEFASNDPDRLADVKFVLLKEKPSRQGDGSGLTVWYRSQIKVNQGDLDWDLNDEEVYISPESRLTFALVDDDGEFVQDLIINPPFERPIPLSSAATNRPDRIEYNDDAVDLSLYIEVDWE
jgi:hypothetical protein